MGKISSFMDIEAWREGHAIVLKIYEITKSFPKEETFGLTSQIRRSAVSITSNIAEGFSRRTYKDKLQFYYISLGSVTELQNQLLIARDLEYISSEQFEELSENSIRTHKLLNGIIKSSKDRC